MTQAQWKSNLAAVWGQMTTGGGHSKLQKTMGVLGVSGGSRIFERGVQVQADYGNSTDCFIMAGEYVYAKSEAIRAKRGKFSEFWTFEIASAGFSDPIQRARVRRSSKLLYTSVPPPLWG